MKRYCFTALLLAAPLAHAQVFLDPEITRRAAETMVTGNIRLNNVDFGGGLQQQAQPMPTAAEIAAEIRRQNQREISRREANEREARRERVASAIERGYKAEFRK
jgi:hypothetical protein